jgi:hypothetical protein
MGLLALTAATSANAACPTEPQVVADFGAPMYDVQATLDIKATEPPAGSVMFELTFEDPTGRRVSKDWFGARPAYDEVSLPADGRGFPNIVRVWAQLIGDPTGVTCDVSVEHGPPVPLIDQECYRGTVVRTFPSPQKATQVSVRYESRPTPGNAFHLSMTNSRGQEALIDQALVGGENTPLRTVSLPADQLGVWDVVSIKLQTTFIQWWDVLRCSPSVSTAGPMSAAQLKCWSRNITLDNPHPELPSEMVIKLAARGRTAYVLFWDSFHPDGSGAGDYTELIGPAVSPSWFGYGATKTNIGRFNARIGIEWPRLLACEASVQPLQRIDPPQPGT